MITNILDNLSSFWIMVVVFFILFFLKESHYWRFKYRKMGFIRRFYFNNYSRVNSSKNENRHFKEIQNKYALWLLLIVIYLVCYYLFQHFLFN